MIGFCLHFVWLRAWRELFNRTQSVVKTEADAHYFDTQLRTALTE